MSALDIEAALARCEAATPGPWRLGLQDRLQVVVDNDNADEVADVGWGVAVGDEDAEFIAHARTDLPAALALLDQCRVVLKAVEWYRVERGHVIKDYDVCPCCEAGLNDETEHGPACELAAALRALGAPTVEDDANR